MSVLSSTWFRARSQDALRRRVVAALWAVGLVPGVQGVPTITAVPLPAGATYNDVRCLSRNGAVVAGLAGPLANDYLYTWSAPSIPVIIPKPPSWGYYRPDGMNLDGTAFTGYRTTGGNPNNSIAYRWTQALGFQDLGTLGGDSSWGYAISDDGQVVTGYSWTGSNPVDLAFRWTPGTGMVGLPIAGGLTNHFGWAMNGAGTAIVGTGYTNAGEVIFRWTQAGGTENLGPGAGSAWGGGTAVSADGTAIAGYSAAGACYDGLRRTDSGGFEMFGGFLNYSRITPRGITPDGTAIVSNLQVQCGLYTATNRAGVWTQARGMVELMSYLSGEGVNLTGWTLYDVVGVSNDGTTLAGNGVLGGVSRGWVVRGIRPICGPWIAFEPVSLQACVGSTTGFSVQAYAPTIPGHPSFQWYKRVYQIDGEPNDTPLANGPSGTGSSRTGVYTPFMQISNVGAPDAGFYFCRVYEGCAPADTQIVTLGVSTVAPGIVSSPASASKCTFKTVTFSASAGTPSAAPLSVTWKKAGVPINLSNPRFTVVTAPNTLSSTLTITNIQMSDASSGAAGYTCEFANGCGSPQTAAAALTVLPNLSGNGGPIGTADLVIVLGNFGQNVTPYTNGDLNGDGVVNTLDLTAMLGQFGQSCPP